MDSMPYKVCEILVRSSSGRSLVIYSTSLLSVVAGHLKLSERKITCLNLEKCSLLLTPPAEIARETYGSVMQHLLSPLFSSYRTKFEVTIWPAAGQRF